MAENQTKIRNRVTETLILVFAIVVVVLLGIEFAGDVMDVVSR
jgi:hypothetical protein